MMGIFALSLLTHQTSFLNRKEKEEKKKKKLNCALRSMRRNTRHRQQSNEKTLDSSIQQKAIGILYSSSLKMRQKVPNLKKRPRQYSNDRSQFDQSRRT
jgi:hypothetical protein